MAGGRSAGARRRPFTTRRAGKRILAHPLSKLFPNATILDVLSRLLLNPGRDFYQAELVAKTGRALLQVQRALQRIEAAGLATRARRGNRVYYQAERDHPAFEDLKRVLLKTVALGDVLRAALCSIGDQVRLAFIFGSFASGKESSSSDVDLLIVGDLSSRRAAVLLGPLGRDLGRELNPVVYAVEEFRKRATSGDHFVQQVLKGSKIWIIGNDEELERLVG